MILDKSALEALSVDEAVWLEAFLDINVVPVFYFEVLADLEKKGRQGKPPESTVGRLAEKTPSNAYPNVDHRQIVLAELSGQKIEMTHRPVIRAGDFKRSSDGQIGVHLDEFPEQTALGGGSAMTSLASSGLSRSSGGRNSPRAGSRRDGRPRQDHPATGSEDF